MPAFPYITNKTPFHPPLQDVVVLFNMDINGTVNWAKEYAYSNPTDLTNFTAACSLTEATGSLPAM
ncbi:MAG: hypothetical protein IPN33_22045 [Saprospiraceae bacterium]|nr:hypothetical protein [Saprospiraceae bacterium]